MRRLIALCGVVASLVGSGCSSDDGSRSAGNEAGANAVAGAGGAAGAASGSAGTGHSAPGERVVVYLPSYRGPLSGWTTRLDFTRVTHVNLSFATIAPDGTLAYPDAALGTFVAAAHAANVKVLMALGGGDTIADGLGAATEALIAPAGRDAFIEKIASYVESNQLDGIDIDFEGAKAVNQDYEGFVTALAPALRARGKLTTAALATWFASSVTTPALQAFDFVNVMVYYQTDPDNSPVPVSPDALSIDQAVLDFFVNRGLAKDRAVFGVPFYGYFWKGGGSALPTAIGYQQIVAQFGAEATREDVITRGTDVLLLNGRRTISSKAQLARGYGGTMVWEIGQDSLGEGSLLNAIRETF